MNIDYYTDLIVSVSESVDAFLELGEVDDSVFVAELVDMIRFDRRDVVSTDFDEFVALGIELEV